MWAAQVARGEGGTAYFAIVRDCSFFALNVIYDELLDDHQPVAPTEIGKRTSRRGGAARSKRHTGLLAAHPRTSGDGHCDETSHASRLRPAPTPAPGSNTS